MVWDFLKRKAEAGKQGIDEIREPPEKNEITESEVKWHEGEKWVLVCYGIFYFILLTYIAMKLYGGVFVLLIIRVGLLIFALVCVLVIKIDSVKALVVRLKENRTVQSMRLVAIPKTEYRKYTREGSEYYALDELTGGMILPCSELDTRKRIIKFSNYPWDSNIRMMTDITVLKDLRNWCYTLEDELNKLRTMAYYSIMYYTVLNIEELTMRKHIDPYSLIFARDFGQNDGLLKEDGSVNEKMTSLPQYSLMGGDPNVMEPKQRARYVEIAEAQARKTGTTKNRPQWVRDEINRKQNHN